MMHASPGARVVLACCLVACVAPLTAGLEIAESRTVQELVQEDGTDYMVVVPRRVDSDALPLDRRTHYLRRGKRDIYSEQQLSNLVYQIDLGKNKHYLHLRPFSSFIAPGMVIQHMDYNRTWMREPEAWRHCFYSGTVDNVENSKATVSICEHMHGTFRILDDHYFIEPHPEHINRTEGDIPHIVYPWKSLPHHVNQAQHCGMDSHGSSLKNWHYPRNFTENDWSFNQEHHSRQKRSLSKERYVETMLVADVSMLKYHGSRIETYLLTLMSIVADLYRDSSIGNSIKVVVVRLLLLQSEKEGPKITKIAARTLKEFCSWQDKQNLGDDDHVLHHDTAVLLTRQDICRSHSKCDTLGLAELGTMCNKKKSCSITEDNGVSAAYTMAHELGHVFNLPHDTDYRCKKFEDQRNGIYHMMAPTLYQGTKPWNWSECSRHILTEFLDAGYGDCLNDKPGNREYINKMTRVAAIQPGETYNVNEQCQMVYGRQTRLCPYNPSSICQDLWCLDPNGACMTEHMPWADGSPCGPNKWCWKGRCAYQQERKPVDGGWSEWGPWGPCSRSCGGGIKRSHRRCTNPRPVNGGQYCLGDRIKYKSCNYNITCGPYSVDFRELQCSHQNPKINQLLLPKKYRWVPKYSGIHHSDRCKLFCRISGTNAFFLLKNKVEDGTKCGQDTFDMCVNGKCRSAGCDHMLGSNKTLDRCGNCDGDNSTCKHIHERHKRRVHYGYNPVAKIPAGSSEIQIRQQGPGTFVDDNYLAVTNGNGSFLLNGGMVVTLFRKVIPVKGAFLEYSGSNQIVESLNCTNRIQEELNVYVLSVGNVLQPEISYQYITSLKTVHFKWVNIGPWGKCNRICQGIRAREIVCLRIIDGTHVAPDRCQGQVKPKQITEACATHCTLRWKVTDEGVCPARCGTAIQKRKVRCVRQERDYPEKAISSQFCSHLNDKPPDTIKCTGKCLATSWAYQEWSKCSKSCGVGFQRRGAVCVDSNQQKLPHYECAHEKAELIQPCNTQACPVWKTGNWSGCSVTCGDGFRYRHISCLLEGQKISKALCDGKKEPIRQVQCNLGDCPLWHAHDWTPCSVSCGTGIQTRRVDCQAPDGDLLEDNECNAAQQPLGQRECYQAPCPTVPLLTTTPLSEAHMALLKATWRTGSWTKCSRTCGAGVKRRYVSCRELDGGKIASDELCEDSPKPSLTQPCFDRPCGQWRYGHWTECSVTCGEGSQKRYVACIIPNQLENLISDMSECDVKVMPVNERTCNRDPCVSERDFQISNVVNNQVENRLFWRSGPWSQCSSTCGPGWRQRRVVCQNERGERQDCDEDMKPPERLKCNPGPCPVWKIQGWSRCSVTCGGGIQTRNMTCEMPSGKPMPEDTCPISRPKEVKFCFPAKCAGDVRWRVSPWSKCSTTCGRGVAKRNITCVDEEGLASANSSLCEHLPEPEIVKTCRKGRCPRWKSKAWSPCSVSCGIGTQTRSVICRIPRRGPVNESRCDPATKPTTEKACNITDCRNYKWELTKWSKCTRSCGNGLKLREAVCIVSDTKEKVAEEKCLRRKRRPRTSRGCFMSPCPYAWYDESGWSQCSKPCGEGIQTRNITCRGFSPEGWLMEFEVADSYCDPDERPPSNRTCNYGSCNATHVWTVGEWGQCSETCGAGRSRRKVYCVDIEHRKSHPRRLCDESLRPKTSKPCNVVPCYASSCSEFKKLSRIRIDGEYRLQVQGTLVKVYCHELNKRSHPKEYLSLPSGDGDNFSLIYHKRLVKPNICPPNGTSGTVYRRPYDKAGITRFSKLRLNITTLQVVLNDFTFARGNYAKVPYATGGDCYSSKPCPQGRFKINLQETGFRVSGRTMWKIIGHKTTKRIRATLSQQVVEGHCGGRCGQCHPSRRTGLQLEVIP